MPGDLVVIKSNLVKHYDVMAQYECTLTHPSVIKAIIDYCVIAKAGHIIVGDAPIQGANMDKIRKDCHIDEMIQFYQSKGIDIEFCDFRDYIIERKILEEDVIINLPKPKTHRYAGLTGAQKNFVGCCSDKESLPHFKAGSPCVGGDETNSDSILSKKLAKYYRKYLWACKKKQYVRTAYFHLIYRGLYELKGDHLYTNGAWYGNDTIWRTILDLNKIMLFADKSGKIHMDVPQRKIFTLGDMIIAGEKEGPLNPTAKSMGVVVVTDNMAIFDYVFCKIAGFDETLIPTIHHSVRNTHLSPENWKEIVISSNDERVDGNTIFDVAFPEEYWLEPHPFWKELF